MHICFGNQNSQSRSSYQTRNYDYELTGKSFTDSTTWATISTPSTCTSNSTIGLMPHANIHTNSFSHWPGRRWRLCQKAVTPSPTNMRSMSVWVIVHPQNKHSSDALACRKWRQWKPPKEHMDMVVIPQDSEHQCTLITYTNVCRLKYFQFLSCRGCTVWSVVHSKHASEAFIRSMSSFLYAASHIITRIT